MLGFVVLIVEGSYNLLGSGYEETAVTATEKLSHQFILQVKNNENLNISFYKGIKIIGSYWIILGKKIFSSATTLCHFHFKILKQNLSYSSSAHCQSLRR